MEPIKGVAAGVPYLAVPPPSGDPAAPVVVIWHLMDAPRTEVAMAAALPLAGVAAWRLYLGLPFTGARMPAGGLDEIFALVQEDTLLRLHGAAIVQAAAEFPAALAALRKDLNLADGPVTVVGGSAGGGAALLSMAEHAPLIRAGVLLNAAIRGRTVVSLVERVRGLTYVWSEESRSLADRLDFVARADELAGRPLLIVSGEEDHAGFQADAAELAKALPASAELAKIPGLAHPLAEEPGLAPAPQTASARAVDAVVTAWLNQHPNQLPA